MSSLSMLLRRSATCLMVMALIGCASGLNKDLEKARFLLDQERYGAAADKAQGVLDGDPDNVEAKFLLASALIGSAYLGDDRTYLGLMADLQRNQGKDESTLGTFLRIAPGFSEQAFSQLQEARDVLLSIPAAQRDPDVYLQLYTVRLFEISIVLSRIGADSDDDVCNADPTNTNPDGVPDEFDPDDPDTQLDAEESKRFQNNIDNVNEDGANAGLPDDFALNDRMIELSTDLNQSISDAGDQEAGTVDFFIDQFGDPDDVSLCL